MMVVKGVSYRTNLPGTLQLTVLRQMKRDFGFGWGTVTQYMGEMEDATPLGDIICDDEFLAWMYAYMLNAGAQITRQDLEQLTVDDIEFTTNDSQPDPGGEVEAVPTSAPTDSDRGERNAVPKGGKRTTASTKTSKKQSTPA